MKTQTFLLIALLTTGFLPMVEAGSQTSPEITDAADDQAVDAGPLQAVLDLLPGVQDVFADVDILKAWVNETDALTFTIGIEAAGDVVDDTKTTVSFSADHGASSEFGSTANGTILTIELTGNTVDTGPANTAASSTGAVMTITLTRADAGISGGDVFSNFTVDRARNVESALAPIIADQDATDSAGPGDLYTFNRIPVVGAATAQVTGGMVGTESFTGTEAHLHDGVVGHFNVKVTNTGTDVDTFTLQSTVTAGVSAVISDPGTFTLDPASEQMVMVNFNATGADGMVLIDMHLTSVNNAVTMFNLTLEVEAHGGTGGNGGGTGGSGTGGENARQVTPSFLSPLTPMAEALGFDEVFDDYAELVLLLLMILLLILLLLLLLLLLRRGWLQGTVDPKSITAAPGDDVEFDVTVQNRRKDYHTVQASFASEGATVGLTMKPEDGTPMQALTSEGQTANFDLTGKGEMGDFAEGTLSMQAPQEEGKHHVDVWFTPLDEDGEPRSKKASRVRATVHVQDGAAAASALSLGEIKHRPAAPLEGDNVLTSTQVHNSSGDDADLRVVLLVDNEPIQEETVHLPSGASANVEFPWTAARGKNKIRVQVFEA